MVPARRRTQTLSITAQGDTTPNCMRKYALHREGSGRHMVTGIGHLQDVVAFSAQLLASRMVPLTDPTRPK